ncbi:MAG: permease [Spirochaetes bacterium]|nr:permease [Spirochaetota bacterium]
MGTWSMRGNLGTYRFLLTMGFLWIGLYFTRRDLSVGALAVSWQALKEMLIVLPPIFILLGLFDVWVPKGKVVRFMGKGSGLRGVLLSFLAGALIAGPLYGAFPVAAIFLKKHVSLPKVFIFLGAWSTMKIPMFLVEGQSLGWRFAITRLCLNIPGILLIAYFLTLIVKPEEERWIRQQADDLTLG